MKRIPIIFFISILCGLAGCSHAPKKSETGPRLAERLGKWDMNKHSAFEKELLTDKKFKGLKTGPFHTRDYTGTKNCTAFKGDYQTKGFQQSSKISSVADKSFHDAKKDSGLASSQFKTKESSMDQKTSRDADKKFSGTDKTYQTKEVRDATASLKKKSHPVMVDTGKPSYTEDEVRGLLNKN